MNDPDPLKLECLEGFDHGRFGVACRTIQVLLGYGYVDRAVECLRQFAVESRRRAATPQTPLVDVVPVRVANSLEQIGITTLAAFLRASDQQLWSVPNIGEGCIRLREQLRRELQTGELMAGEPVDDLSLDFLKDECPQEVLDFVERNRQVSSASVSVLDALKVIADRGAEAVSEIDSKIADLQAEIDQLKKMRSLLGGKTNPRERGEYKPMQLTDEHVETADKMHKVLTDARAALPPAQIASKIGQHFALVGRIAKADSRFMRYSDGRIGLA